MGILQVSVEPGIIDFFFINFSHGHVGLGIFSVDHITVYIDVVKFVVLSDTLRLVVEGVVRLIIVNSNISDSLCIGIDVFAGQFVICCKGLDRYVVKLICILGIFDVSLEIFVFLINFIRRNDKVLYQIACSDAYHTYDDHNDRNGKYFLKLFFSNMMHYGNCAKQG